MVGKTYSTLLKEAAQMARRVRSARLLPTDGVACLRNGLAICYAHDGNAIGAIRRQRLI